MPTIHERSRQVAEAPRKSTGSRPVWLGLGIAILLASSLYGLDGAYGLKVGIPRVTKEYAEFTGSVTAGEEELRAAEDASGRTSAAIEARRKLADGLRGYDKKAGTVLRTVATGQVVAGSVGVIAGLIVITIAITGGRKPR